MFWLGSVRSPPGCQDRCGVWSLWLQPERSGHVQDVIEEATTDLSGESRSPSKGPGLFALCVPTHLRRAGGPASSGIGRKAQSASVARCVAIPLRFRHRASVASRDWLCGPAAGTIGRGGLPHANTSRSQGCAGPCVGHRIGQCRECRTIPPVALTSPIARPFAGAGAEVACAGTEAISCPCREGRPHGRKDA